MEPSSSSVTTATSESERRKPMMISSTHVHVYDQLHSVRKTSFHKPSRKQQQQQPIAPLPPNPTRVYKVKPNQFKDVVQKLTGAIEFQPTRLQNVAPAPLDLNLGGVVRVVLANEMKLHPAAAPVGDQVKTNGFGFDLSPSSSAWCSFLLSSPVAGGTLLL